MSEFKLNKMDVDAQITYLMQCGNKALDDRLMELRGYHMKFGLFNPQDFMMPRNSWYNPKTGDGCYEDEWGPASGEFFSYEQAMKLAREYELDIDYFERFVHFKMNNVWWTIVIENENDDLKAIVAAVIIILWNKQNEY